MYAIRSYYVKFNVAGVANVLFDKNRRIIKSFLRFGSTQFEVFFNLCRFFHNAHSPTSTAGGCLEDHRVITSYSIHYTKLYDKAYLEDIIQQRTQELERSNASLRLVLQTVPIVFYSYQLPNRQHLWYSEQIESFSGYSKEMLIAEPDLWKSRVHPDDLTAMGEAFDNLNHPQRIAHEYRWEDASYNFV